MKRTTALKDHCAMGQDFLSHLGVDRSTFDWMKYLLFSLTLVVVARPAFGQNELNNIPSSDPEVERASFHLSEDLEANLFISDPSIDKPIQMAWDEKGRLWLATSNSYPQPVPGQRANDKIFVVEDLDQDGTADISTVFKDGLLTPTGILYGDGGVYVANSTEIIHLTDSDGDLIADTQREVLRGFGADDNHHIIHTFNWGPDGRMYMNQSVYIYSNVETPWGFERLRGGGVWRYDTESQKLEVMARGMWNAWGLVFDKDGQSFATDGAGGNGILPIYPGVAYVPAVGVDRTMEGLNPDSPKYAGLEIISGEHFSEDWDGDLITNDFRANKIVRFNISEDGSGYRSVEEEPLVWSDHIAFRPVAVSQGPDGALYVADWYNPIIQHGEVDFRDSRRDHQHGRIWRITSKSGKLVKWKDLGQSSVVELLGNLSASDFWTRKQSRRLLREHQREEVKEALTAWTYSLYQKSTSTSDQFIESLWLHQALDMPSEELVGKMIASSDHRQRRAVARVLSDWAGSIDNVIEHLQVLVSDEHAGVRREAVNTLGGIESFEAARLAISAFDPDIDSFMDYELYQSMRQLEPFWVSKADQLSVSNDASLFALLSGESEEAIKRLSTMYGENRVGEKAKAALDLIARKGKGDDLQILLNLASQDAEVDSLGKMDHLKALEEAARGERMPTEPQVLIQALMQDGDVEIRKQANELVGRWGLDGLRSNLRVKYKRGTIDLEERKSAVNALALFRDSTSTADMNSIISSKIIHEELRLEAAKGLAEVDIEESANQMVLLVSDLEEGDDPVPYFDAIRGRRDAFIYLTEAVNGTNLPLPIAQKLMDEYANNGAHTRNLERALSAQGASFVQPLHGLNLSSKGTLDRLQYSVKAAGDYDRGREVYLRSELQCTRCHAIDGEGGRVGPSLTTIGVQAPTDYLIESLVNPGAAIKDAYATVMITEKDGSVHMGIAKGESASGVTLINAADQEVTIPSERIETTEAQPGSLMPEGIIASLTRDEFVDLVAYLSKLGE